MNYDDYDKEYLEDEDVFVRPTRKSRKSSKRYDEVEYIDYAFEDNYDEY